MSDPYAIILGINKRKEKNVSIRKLEIFSIHRRRCGICISIRPKWVYVSQVKRVPAEMFSAMNADAIRSLIGSISEMPKSEIQAELDRINEGYQQAYLALA